MKPLKIKNIVFGEGTPKICIPLTGRTRARILEQAKQVSGLPHQVAEWRADYFEGVTDITEVSSVLMELRRLLPDSLLLFTFRTKKEGGVKELSEEAYLKLCASMAESGLADLLDLELFTGYPISKVPFSSTETIKNPDPNKCGDSPQSSALSAQETEKNRPIGIGGPETAGLSGSPLPPVLDLAHKHNTYVILSSHDFEKTPPEEEIFRRLAAMERLGGDIAKLAAMPRTPEDVIALLSATCRASRELTCPVITMSMGPLGVVSRVSGRLTGSCLTFGTAGEASAPGQLPAGELERLLGLL